MKTIKICMGTHTHSPLRGLLALVAVCLCVRAGFAQTPDYSGTVCPVDDGLRFDIQTDTNVTNVLIYPNSPIGGGYFMVQDAPGQFSWLLANYGPGTEVSFSLLIQNPQQYSYPNHAFTVGETCAHFQRNDVTPPPARGFRHEIELDGADPIMAYQAGAPNEVIDETTEVILRYRVEQGPLQTMTLQREGQYRFAAPLPADPGEVIQYWFVLQIGAHRMESATFDRTVGEDLPYPIATPENPITGMTGGRFRDRHPYEWRFDQYVELYDSGRAYQLDIIDSGDVLDATITVNPDFAVGRIDFKYFINTDPDQCNRPLTGVNRTMTRNASQPNVFEIRISDVTAGAIIDIDLTFTDLPGDSPVAAYYSDIHYYQVGRGRFGRSGNPRAEVAGEASIPHVVSPRFGFAQHAQGMTRQQIEDFLAGKTTFETDFESGKLLNEPNRFDCCAGPLGIVYRDSTMFREDVLGPRYSATSCIRCHIQDGRGRIPEPGGNLLNTVFNVGISGSNEFGEPNPHPLYGSQFDIDSTQGAQPEGRVTIDWEYIDGAFDDGTPFQLRKPIYTFRDTAYGSLGTNLPDESGTPGYEGEAVFSARMTPMLTGMGLLDALSEDAILANADPNDLDGDGISGRPNMVWDRSLQETVLGRFGWKAGQPNLLQQAGRAFNRDMGMTNPLYPMPDCGNDQPGCTTEMAPPEVPTTELELVREYLAGLVPPPRHNHEDPQAIEGMHLFKAANCQACHVPSLKTRDNTAIGTYRGIAVEAFTDLLLHDMGEGLADSQSEFAASGSEWRTPPLWGLGYVRYVMGLPDTCEDPWQGGQEPNFLHDGRARSIMEAILWHGGEAAASRDHVLAMNASQRSALIRYVEYPFDDPIFHQDQTTPCPADISGDGVVSGIDLGFLLSSWGEAGRGDINADGVVDGEDMGLLLSAWGACQ